MAANAGRVDSAADTAAATSPVGDISPAVAAGTSVVAVDISAEVAAVTSQAEGIPVVVDMGADN